MLTTIFIFAFDFLAYVTMIQGLDNGVSGPLVTLWWFGGRVTQKSLAQLKFVVESLLTSADFVLPQQGITLCSL